MNLRIPAGYDQRRREFSGGLFSRRPRQQVPYSDIPNNPATGQPDSQPTWSVGSAPQGNFAPVGSAPSQSFPSASLAGTTAPGQIPAPPAPPVPPTITSSFGGYVRGTEAPYVKPAVQKPKMEVSPYLKTIYQSIANIDPEQREEYLQTTAASIKDRLDKYEFRLARGVPLSPAHKAQYDSIKAAYNDIQKYINNPAPYDEYFAEQVAGAPKVPIAKYRMYVPASMQPTQ